MKLGSISFVGTDVIKILKKWLILFLLDYYMFLWFSQWVEMNLIFDIFSFYDDPFVAAFW